MGRVVTSCWGLLWLLVAWPVTANPLLPLKTAYDDEAGKIRAEANAQYAALNQQYIRSLETLDTQFKRAGELESLLVVRKELERFRKKEVITEADLVSAPAALADAQRAYVEAKNQIRRDRDLRLAQRTRLYLDQLAQLKKQLTQQDRISEAIAVQQEEDLVRASVDLNPAPPPPAAGSPVKPTAGAGAGVVTPGSAPSPHTMKPPKGYFWIYVSERGQPVRNQSFFFQAEPNGKITEHTSDSFGKVSFLTEPGATYRLRCLSEKYASVELTGLREGESYTLQLQTHPPGAGLVELRNKMATLPELGRITLQYSYSDGTIRYGYLRPENSKVTVTGRDLFFGDRSAFLARDGTKARLQLGDARYEITCTVINDRWFLHYRKLPPGNVGQRSPADAD